MATMKTCILHERELLPLFCKKCEVLVCSDCIENTHNQHEFTGVSSVVGTHKQFLIEQFRSGTSKIKLGMLENKVEEGLLGLQEHSDSLKKEIKIEKENIMEQLEHCEADLLNKVSVLQEKYRLPLQAMKVRLTHLQNVIGLDQSGDTSDRTLTDRLSDTDIVALSEDLKAVLSANDECFDFQTTSFTFFKVDLQSGYGWEFGSVMEETETLSDSGERVTGTLSATKNEEDVFHDCVGLPEVLKGRQIFKSRTSSVTPRSLNSTLVLHAKKVYDITTSQSSDSDHKQIHLPGDVFQIKLSSAGEIYFLVSTIFFQVLKFSLYHITSDERIIRICELGDCINHCCIGFTSKGKIAVISTECSHKTVTIKKEEVTKNGLITRRYDGIQISEKDLNGALSDVVVTTSDKSIVSFRRSILVFDSSFKKLQEVYNGIYAYCSPYETIANGMCLDVYGNILVAARAQNEVHVLDEKLNFLKFLIKKDDGVNEPSSLTFDNQGCLWIGCWDGTVFVLDYKTIFFSFSNSPCILSFILRISMMIN